ncbi:MAG: PhnD/SsuA/transferrin family substrate-binding protein [Planctomycetes bacterium]|nr:PhnD/SsuA/transferrin family substrate-binding protein [Planctomycetota bacterium]
MRIADLPWYDLPELQAATDAWWRGIAAHLRDRGVDRVPDVLSRDGDHAARWRHPDLLLSQACGYDVLYDAAAWIVPVATPCYRLGGACGPHYDSAVVVRADAPWRRVGDLRGTRFVVNEASSHSGTNAVRPLVARQSRAGRFFADVAATGSHTDSLSAVQRGEADAACIDRVVWTLLERVRPAALAGLRVIATTARAWAPPYVTSRRTEPALRAALAAALVAAAGDPALAAPRAALCLEGFTVLPDDAYRDLAQFERPALAAAYFELPAPDASPLSRACGRGRGGGAASV